MDKLYFPFYSTGEYASTGYGAESKVVVIQAKSEKAALAVACECWPDCGAIGVDCEADDALTADDMVIIRQASELE